MKKIFILLIAVFLVIGGLFGLLYTQIWNPSWNPFRPVPSIVLAKMALKMKGLEAFHIEGKVAAKNFKKTLYEYESYYNEKKENISSNGSDNSFNFSLDIDRNNPDSQKSYLITDWKFYNESQYSYGSSSNDYSGGIELKKIDELIYFLLTDAGEGELTEDMKEVILDRWVKINQEEIGDLISLLFEEIDGRISINMPKEKQEELIKNLLKLCIGRDLFEAKNELSDEKIDGQMNYHYSLVLNERETKRLISDIILEMAKFISGSVSVSRSTSSDYYPGYYYEDYFTQLPMIVAQMNMEIQKEIGDFFEQMKGVDIEVWIGQKDGYLHKIKFERDVDLVNYFEEERSEYSNEKILEAEKSVFMDIKLSGFNESIDIEVPETFEDLNRLIRDAKREKDIKQIHSSAEDYYEQDNEYPRFGEYEGTGLAVALMSKEIEVVFVVENSPAFKAGLKTRDKIRKINGASTVGMTADEVGNLIEGPSGTVLNLTVYREEWAEEKNVKIVRAVIEAPLMNYSSDYFYYYSKPPIEIKDPGNGPCSSYQRISNSVNLQKYCIWACLENGKFLAASHKGIKLLEEVPTSLDCW